jgi:hypothetical protein
MAWPEKLMRGTPRDWSLGYLYEKRKSYLRDPAKYLEMVYPGQEMLLGHALPPFQRPPVWTREQNVRFLESAVLGLHLGTWCCNVADDFPTVQVEGREYFDLTDTWLIDGRQRLTALEAYWNDDFAVFGMKWSEVSQTDRRRFLNSTMFTAYELRTNDVAYLREVYDRLNFGGTPHTPDQRAVQDGAHAFPGTEDELPRPRMR